jgi:arsenate reductase
LSKSHRLQLRASGDEVNPAAIAAMKERGIEISSEHPKPWTDEVVRAADVVITMGCGDACPVFPAKALRRVGSG